MLNFSVMSVFLLILRMLIDWWRGRVFIWLRGFSDKLPSFFPSVENPETAVIVGPDYGEAFRGKL